jgi:succinoglycan biosynthesis protein ExoM
MTGKHISVCVCTYKRPELLPRLFEGLFGQTTEGLFSYSIVIADNDQAESARAVVAQYAASSSIAIKYCAEPRQNIALARNKAIENATGDYVAFIDDDEFPAQGWLLNLFKTCEQSNVDGVLGPVKRHFDVTPPRWVVDGNFYERPTHSTGFVISWAGGRTGNLLLKTQLFADGEPPFRPEFRAGEDQDFFRRKIELGHVFIWCNEAVVYEVVPPSRWDRTIMLKRALLRGATTVLHPTFGFREVAKSLVAVPCYIVALPFAFVWGRHHFMKLLVSLFDHLGKLLALVGMNPVKEQYVTE